MKRLIDNIDLDFENLNLNKKHCNIDSSLDLSLDSIKEYSECSIIVIELGMCSDDLLKDSYKRYYYYPLFNREITILINIYISKYKIRETFNDDKELYKLIYKIDKSILELI